MTVGATLRRLFGRIDESSEVAFGRGGRVIGRASISIDGRFDLGEHVTVVSQPAPTHIVVTRDAHLDIGDGVSLGQGTAISCSQRVSIGANTSIGPFGMIADSDFHVAGDESAEPIPKPIIIGRDVVVGPHVVLLPGSEIGDGATVDAGSVVSGAVAEGAFVAGNPAVRSSTSAVAGGRGAVGELIADVFDLESVPDSSTTPDQIHGWDSLGALRLLVAIESNFSVRVEESVAGSIDSVGGWERYVAELTAAAGSE